jgi:hypothetical protein
LAKKGLSAIVGQRDLVETLVPEAAAYSSVTRCLRTPSFRAENEEQEIQGEETLIGEIKEAILKVFSDIPFSSVRELVWHI